MKIDVRTEKEAAKVSQFALLATGTYDAQIIEAFEKTSQSGKSELMELLLSTRDKNGVERIIRDWLVGNDRGALKLRHAAEAVGALAKYEAGEIEQSDFVGQHVRVKVIIEKRRGYPDQNRISDYTRHAR